MTRYRCIHGLTLTEPCKQCDLAAAQAVLDQWSTAVDEARKVVEELTKETS